MEVILSLSQLLLSFVLAMFFGSGLVFVGLAGISRSTGDTCLVVGWVDSLGWLVLVLVVVAGFFILMS